MTVRRLYPTTLTVGPNRHPRDQIRDAESFCRSYLDRCFADINHYERESEYDDSLSMLITHLWRLGETFDPERNDCFAAYARSIIPKRAYDVSVRRLLGRNGHRLPDYLHDELDENAPASGPSETLPLEPSSPDPDRREYPGWIPADRAGREAWAAAVLGIRTPRIAA